MCVVSVGGTADVRRYWSNFVQDTDILVFVVDSADEKRLPEAFDELHKVLGDDRLKRVPIVILANKQVGHDRYRGVQILKSWSTAIFCGCCAMISLNIIIW